MYSGEKSDGVKVQGKRPENIQHSWVQEFTPNEGVKVTMSSFVMSRKYEFRTVRRSRKRCEIGPRLLQDANRKSHTGDKDLDGDRRLWMTLNSHFATNCTLQTSRFWS